LKSNGFRKALFGTDATKESESTNAYLRAFPIATALAGGADIVVTNQIVKNAVIIGPLIYEFGWTKYDNDLLAAVTAKENLLEFETRPTGCTFTGWQDLPDLRNIGFRRVPCAVAVMGYRLSRSQTSLN
jgi:hypothetical protein